MPGGFVVAIVVVVVVAVAVLAALVVSARLVGQIADEFGEERVKWQVMMLPFGPFGPLLARALLTGRSGRGGGPSNFA